MKNTKTVIIVLIGLLLICLIRLPYGYYQFVRFASFAGFGYLAYQFYKKGQETTMFILIALAVLFQPFFKISLGRTLWNIVDVGVAVYLLVLLMKLSNSSTKDQ